MSRIIAVHVKCSLSRHGPLLHICSVHCHVAGHCYTREVLTIMSRTIAAHVKCSLSRHWPLLHLCSVHYHVMTRLTAPTNHETYISLSRRGPLLHTRPIPRRIQYKINTVRYKCITRTAPSYLCGLTSTLHTLPYSSLCI